MPKKVKSKGKRGGKKGGKKKKGGKSKKDKKQLTEVPVPPPEPDTFFWVRRQMTSILIEAHEEMTIPELKEIVAGVVGKPVESIGLFKDKKQLEDFKKEGGEKNDTKSSGRGGSKAKQKKEKPKKSKSKGKKGKDDNKGSSKEKKGPEPEPEAFKIMEYGLNAQTSSIFRPATLALVYKEEEQNKFEPVAITPWTEGMKIPESVKPFLRNYTDHFAVTETPNKNSVTDSAKKEGRGAGNLKRK